MAIRNNIFKLVGTAFFVAGFYLLIESQWVYAAVSFLIGIWYFVQSVRKHGTGKSQKHYGSNDSVEDGADQSAGDSLDGGDSGGGGGDD